MYTIAAVDRNWAIGKDGDQFCYLPEDLKRFKTLTAGHAVILGRKTLAALPGGRPLKGRRNLVLSANPDLRPEGAEVCPDLESLLQSAPTDAFVIGGGSVYRALLPYCDTAYITKIDREWAADTWFPDLDADKAWEKTEETPSQEYEGISFRYVTYRRK
ncbi:MAG: dihydrofolate reductase [Clostridia bacterium]|nr:dihydrofolate reductase [Clostridia bacterium]